MPIDRTNWRARWNGPTYRRALSSASVHGWVRSRSSSSQACATSSEVARRTGIGAAPVTSPAARQSSATSRCPSSAASLRRSGGRARIASSASSIRRSSGSSSWRTTTGRSPRATSTPVGKNRWRSAVSRNGPAQLELVQLGAEEAVEDAHVDTAAVLVTGAGRHQHDRAPSERFATARADVQAGPRLDDADLVEIVVVPRDGEVVVRGEEADRRMGRDEHAGGVATRVFVVDHGKSSLPRRCGGVSSSRGGTPRPCGGGTRSPGR